MKIYIYHKSQREETEGKIWKRIEQNDVVVVSQLS